MGQTDNSEAPGQVETDQGLTLVKNDNYWNGTPKLDRIEVKTIRDGDTMTMALQSGELDAAYGLPYSNLILFRDEPYTISSADTSRTFFGQFNGSSDFLQRCLCTLREKRQFLAARIREPADGQAFSVFFHVAVAVLIGPACFSQQFSGTAEKRKLGCLCQRICQRTDGRSRVFLYNALPAGFLQEPRRLLQ